MFVWPTSSPKMTRMLGFLAWALATPGAAIIRNAADTMGRKTRARLMVCSFRDVERLDSARGIPSSGVRWHLHQGLHLVGRRQQERPALRAVHRAELGHRAETEEEPCL